ncbi:hypothetical protein TRICI_002986 [Trichomonascus ciferrii]|uniref:Membrane anchor Opy2 N-terminal domain-containing protein n=1 Tax=Trichomonascus ciferrii TaxID=44093 RepID=A0A642V4U1_9ASCO|nr:hypothetical protein TRICI_002986 [Trichomonascus ciferrii]
MNRGGLYEFYLERRGCKKCTETPKCPACPDGEECTLTTQTCDACAEGICQKKSTGSDSDSDSPSVNKGAIAGGVVAGVVVVAAVIGFLLWRYVFSEKAKRRREEEAAERAAEAAAASEKSDGGGGGGSRMSSATLSSVNTSMTRGSNIIPIAYIPGVTNRTDSDAPPVPDINQYSQTFSADDILRHSQMSRSSIATTNYRGSTAEISAAMMTAVNVKPNLVDIGKDKDNDGEEQPQYATAMAVNNPKTVQYGNAQAINSQRANAHSIRIGKKTGPVGLQKDMISEEASDDEDSDNETFHDVQSNVNSNSSGKNNSGYDLPFVIEKNQTDETLGSSTDRQSRLRNETTNRDSSADYVVDDIPIEAYLYAQNNSNNQQQQQQQRTNNGNGRSSPFDDKYKVEDS